MFSRMKIAALLAAAAGGPYVASETQWGQSAVGSISGALHLPGGGSGDRGLSASPVHGAGHALYDVESLRGTDTSRFRLELELARKLGALPADPNVTPELATIGVADLREVLRFDITPRWVLGRFARVSTVLADLRLEGLRVPIVTGTRADDLAGTLTYYFDGQDELQRVTFHGFTGDPNRLVQTMTTHYGLANQPTLEAGAYTKQWNGSPVHFLRLTHAPVVYADAAHQKYTVFMELNQPDLAFGISEEARRIVDSDHHSGRW